MDNEQEQTGLVLYDRTQAPLEKKRRELEEALERGEVGDPASLLAIGILVVATYATAKVGAWLASRGQPKSGPQERGRMTGELAMNAELGVLIPEIYGGDPGDGYGGTWVPGIIIWTNGLIRKHENVSRQETGGGKGGSSSHSTDTIVDITWDLDWALMWCRGPARVLRSKANTDYVFDLYGEVSSYEAELATLTAPYQVVAYQAANKGYEATLQGSGGATAAATFSVQSNGAATRQWTVFYRTNTGTSQGIAYSINGGAETLVTLPPSPSNTTYARYTVSSAFNNGTNTIKIRNTSTTLNIGIDRIYMFPGHSSGNATGIFNSGAGVDGTYTLATPPGPTSAYTTATARYAGEGAIDDTGSETGTTNQGGSAAYAVYYGTTTQLPDPTIEAAIDALYGSGSTPAYRGRCYEVDTNFYLTRYGNALPNRTALVEHLYIKTLAQLSAHFCERVNLLSTDYDFSNVATATIRGLRITGRRFEAREPLQSAERAYNVYYAEEDGVLVCRTVGSVSVTAVADADLGWVEQEGEPDQPLTLLDSTEPRETELPRRIDVKFVDLDRDGEPGLQSYARQLDGGEDSKVLELNWTFTRDEAQAIAQREVFWEHVSGRTYRTTVDWSKLWWNCGNIVPATLAEGSSHSVMITKITGSIGLLTVEGVALDSPIFTQVVTTDPNVFELPPAGIPAMSILALLDLPIRDADETLNNGAVMYAAATPRTNSEQAWTGASLYVDKVGWERVADFTKPATIGVIVSTTNISTSTTTTGFDSGPSGGTITVDLYDSTSFSPTLESVTEAEVLAGANLCAISTSSGEALVQFTSAVRVGGFTNRWTLSGLLHGRKGTEATVQAYAAGRRFILLNEAVKPVPMALSDLNREYDYKAVTSGQSLDDAATVSFTWTGKSLKPLAPIIEPGQRGSNNDLLIQLTPRTRVGGGAEKLTGRAHQRRDG